MTSITIPELEELKKEVKRLKEKVAELEAGTGEGTHIHHHHHNHYHTPAVLPYTPYPQIVPYWGQTTVPLTGGSLTYSTTNEANDTAVPSYQSGITVNPENQLQTKPFTVGA